MKKLLLLLFLGFASISYSQNSISGILQSNDETPFMMESIALW
jgi:hypothetical protein